LFSAFGVVLGVVTDGRRSALLSASLLAFDGATDGWRRDRRVAVPPPPFRDPSRQLLWPRPTQLTTAA